VDAASSYIPDFNFLRRCSDKTHGSSTNGLMGPEMKCRLAISIITILAVAQATARTPSKEEFDLELELETQNETLNPFRQKPSTAQQPAQQPQPRPAAKPAAAAPQGNIEDRGQALVSQGKFDEAIALLKPNSDVLQRKGLLVLARAYAGKKDALNEVRTMELCSAKNPQDYYVLTALGDALSRAKRSEEAIAKFRESRELNPRYRPAYEGLFRELETTGDRYEARIVSQDIIKNFGNDPKFASALCRLYAMEAYSAKSLEHCQTALETDPKNPDNYIYLGMGYKSKEEPDKARNLLFDAARRFPASEKVQVAAAEIHSTEKNFVSAYKHYKQAVSAEPRSARAHLGLANAAFELQKTEEALHAYVVSCSLKKNEVTKDFRLAIGRLRQRKDLDWRTKYEDALGKCLAEPQAPAVLNTK
jgi:tetratricopeptide (TPR) repeat protein